MSILCNFCNADITDKVRKERHYSTANIPARNYCDRECRRQADVRDNHFARMGMLGNRSQQVFKTVEGKIPEYEKRRDAVATSNRKNPRRRKKEPLKQT